MSEISTDRGSDTYVRSDHPRHPYSGGEVIRVQSGSRFGYVRLPFTDIRGRTVLSATLTGHVRGTFSAQTVTVAGVTEKWSPSTTTYNHQPAVGAGVPTTLPAKVDGEAADLDVTAIVQSAANGAKLRGFRLATSTSTADRCNWYAFDSDSPAWTLTIELSDAPEQPSDLRPDGGLGVGSARPVLAWSYTDLGGDSSDQGAFKVQVDPDADEVSPAFDTGWITSTVPEYDLSSGTFTALASHAATQWRVMTRDAGGNESVWSDWASFSYEPYFTVTMDSPTGGVIGDATPDIIAHITGETLTQWRAHVEDAAGNVLWRTQLQDGPIEVTVPFRNDDGRRVIRRDDASYDFVVRAWGDVDRAVAVGLPAYVEQRVTVVFDDDAGVTTPTSFAAAPADTGDPRLTFTWDRTEAPDAVLILDDGKVYARLDEDDWTLDAGTYTWTDTGLAAPYAAHHFTIRAIESGVRSHPSETVTVTTRPEGAWVIAAGRQPVCLAGTATPFIKNDRRATFKPINISEDVDIVTGQEGVSGHFDGFIFKEPGVNVLSKVATLEDIRADLDATPQLVWATQSIPATLKNLTALPDGDVFDEDNLQHTVSFDFTQAGD